MASSGMLLVLFCLPSLFAFAHSRNVNAGMESTTVLDPASNKLGDTYCCLKDGFGCQQQCDSALEYECCIKNGFGCQYMCQKDVPHYCCEKNGFGCTKMCPTTSNLNIALPNAE